MNYEAYMQRAIELAESARGKTSPNPLVGALVVKDGSIVGEGYHKAAGGPHAEIIALNQAAEKAQGAVLFSTLEPCCTFGRTAPCTEAIVSSGVAKVVIGLIDPNPRVQGQGLQEIQRAGIEVFSGVSSKEIARQNEVYLKYITTKRPFVLLKAALSLNGKIASERGKTTWLTGKAAQKEAHRLRAQCDAIMVGRGTVMADDPILTARVAGENARNPVRIIVDSKARLPLDAKVVTDSSAPTILATTEEVSEKRIEELKEKGLEIVLVPSKEGKVDLDKLMEELGKAEITSVLLEGGAALNTAALKAGIVDKFVFFIAPKIINGPKALGFVEGGLEETLWQELEITQVKELGEDLMVEAYPKTN